MNKGANMRLEDIGVLKWIKKLRTKRKDNIKKKELARLALRVQEGCYFSARGRNKIMETSTFAWYSFVKKLKEYDPSITPEKYQENYLKFMALGITSKK